MSASNRPPIALDLEPERVRRRLFGLPPLQCDIDAAAAAEANSWARVDVEAEKLRHRDFVKAENERHLEALHSEQDRQILVGRLLAAEAEIVRLRAILKEAYLRKG